MMNANRQGFTLVELLVVTLVGSIVLGAVYKTLTIQERTNRHQLAIVSTEGNVRTALAVVSSDLREVSATGGDIVAADAQSITYRALRKAGIICAFDGLTGSWANVTVYGSDLFEAGDSLLVFADVNPVSALDDIWITTAAATVGGGTCPGNPIGGTIRRIRTAPTVLSQVNLGGLVRSFRTVGYRIVDEGSGATLYRSENGTEVAIVEGLSTIANQGLVFRYYKADGTLFTPTTQVLRDSIMSIEIKVRASAVGGNTGATREFSDSLVGRVFLRGNEKRL